MQMEFEQKGKDILLLHPSYFAVGQTLTCGQMFRYDIISESLHVLTAFGRVVELESDAQGIWLRNVDKDEFVSVWMDYFDLKTDYKKIVQVFYKDKIMEQAITFASGIRVCNQAFFECLISFILSQNKSIPMIKNMVRSISERYGTRIGVVNGQVYYAFPSPEQLMTVTESGFLECKAGFRAKYLVDAIRKVQEGMFEEKEIQALSTPALKERLMQIYGVGTKVSDCILLFSCGRKEVFPVDVWIRRIMSHFYFSEREVSTEEIHVLAKQKFGAYGGIAQQYLFHYARENQIGAFK